MMRSARWTGIFAHVRLEIEHFFTIYKELEGRKTADVRLGRAGRCPEGDSRGVERSISSRRRGGDVLGAASDDLCSLASMENVSQSLTGASDGL